MATEAHDPFVAADESTFRKTLLGGDNMLPRKLIRDMAATVASRNIRFEWLNGDEAPVAEPIVAESLFGATELRQDERGKVLGRPFKDWMTFLDPDQIGLVNINFTGPARFSGPAGTGKTVVALHRMARFVKESPGRVMFTSFVKTLSKYHESAFQRLALMQLLLVHQIAGGGQNAQLLLVGDGQQQVYAGGWKLSDAGIPLPGGRGRVLRKNYRNREAVLRSAQRIEAANTVDDLDGGPGFVLRDSETVLPGGRAVEKAVRRAKAVDELVRALDEFGYAASDTAVIVGSRRDPAVTSTLSNVPVWRYCHSTVMAAPSTRPSRSARSTEPREWTSLPTSTLPRSRAPRSTNSLAAPATVPTRRPPDHGGADPSPTLRLGRGDSGLTGSCLF